MNFFKKDARGEGYVAHDLRIYTGFKDLLVKKRGASFKDAL
jgi:hypothetical protein